MDLAESGNSFDANTYLLRGAKPAPGKQKHHWAWTMKNASGVAVNVGLSFDEFQLTAKQEINGRIKYSSGDCNGGRPATLADVRLKADDSHASVRMQLLPLLWQAATPDAALLHDSTLNVPKVLYHLEQSHGQHNGPFSNDDTL